MIHHSPLEAIRVEKETSKVFPGFDFSYRRQAYLPGLWKHFPSRVEMLLNFVAEELLLPVTHLNQRIPGAHLLRYVCGINPAAVSRLRHNPSLIIPVDWCYRLHDFSGIPLDELFKLAGHTRIPAHVNARKETSHA